ncbi:MAG: peptide deformylase [Candidatus Saccharimonadales bacterium]
MKVLRRTQFGNPILRLVASQVPETEIKSTFVQDLIADMRYTLENKKYGVGLAAPQVGVSLRLALIGSKPTPSRPKALKLNMVLINPKITKYHGKKTGMWEGCISGPDMYGQAMRHKKITLNWTNETGTQKTKTFEGLVSQIIQHEIDHLDGKLFVDRVEDSKTYMTFSEYRKMMKKERKKLKNKD